VGFQVIQHLESHYGTYIPNGGMHNITNKLVLFFVAAIWMSSIVLKFVISPTSVVNWDRLKVP